jgi:hypothetical protein
MTIPSQHTDPQIHTLTKPRRQFIVSASLNPSAYTARSAQFRLERGHVLVTFRCARDGFKALDWGEAVQGIGLDVGVQ